MEKKRSTSLAGAEQREQGETRIPVLWEVEPAEDFAAEIEALLFQWRR